MWHKGLVGVKMYRLELSRFFPSNGSTFYQYDGNGQRVAKARDTGLTIYVFDVFGKLTSEYTNFPVGAPPCATCYLSQDHLGNTRLVTDAAGNTIARHDYRPFGDEITTGYAGRTADWAKYDGVKQKFTGQEHDGETQFDFFQARYLSAAQQRFMSPDPGNAGADPMNPQSWNAYAYVRDNPMNATDPTGMFLSLLPKDKGNSGDDGSGDPGDLCILCLLPRCILCFGPGGGAPSQEPPPQPVKFTVTVTATPPKTGTRPTFNACMAAHANDFSILGAVNAGTNALFNRQDTYKNNVVLGALGGNSITSLLYGSTADAAGTGVTLAPTIVTAAMGTVTSYGRRTSTIMALNIAGKGGLPLALGASSAGAKAALTTAGKWLGLGLDFEVKLGIDAAFAAAEAAYCYSQTQ
jgi:RHS repeat-associated protein